MALQALEHLEGALLGSARRQLDVGDQIALVLGGQKGAGQAAIERHQGRQQDGEQQEIGQQSADGAGHPAFETAGQAFEAPVEGAEEAARAWAPWAIGLSRVAHSAGVRLRARKADKRMATAMDAENWR